MLDPGVDAGPAMSHLCLKRPGAGEERSRNDSERRERKVDCAVRRNPEADKACEGPDGKRRCCPHSFSPPVTRPLRRVIGTRPFISLVVQVDRPASLRSAARGTAAPSPSGCKLSVTSCGHCCSGCARKDGSRQASAPDQRSGRLARTSTVKRQCRRCLRAFAPAGALEPIYAAGWRSHLPQRQAS